MSDLSTTQQAQPPNQSNKQQEQARPAAPADLLTWKDPNSTDQYVLHVRMKRWFKCIDKPQPPAKPFQPLSGPPPAYLAQQAAVRRAFQAMGASLGQTPAPVAGGTDPSKQQSTTQAGAGGTPQTTGVQSAQKAALAAGAAGPPKQQLPTRKLGVVDIDGYDLPPAERTRKRGERRADTQCANLGSKAGLSTPKRRGRPPGSQNRKRERTLARPVTAKVKKGRVTTSDKPGKPSGAKPRLKPETAADDASKAPTQQQQERSPWFSIHQQHILHSAHPHLPSNLWNTNHWEWNQNSRFVNIGIERDFAALAGKSVPTNARIEAYRDMGLAPSNTVVPGEYAVGKDRIDAHLSDWWQDGKLLDDDPNRFEWPNEATTLFADIFDADAYPEGLDMNVQQPDPSEIFAPKSPQPATFSGPVERAEKRENADRKCFEANEALLGLLGKYQSPENDFIDFAEPREEILRTASVERRVKRMQAERMRYRAPQTSAGPLASLEQSSTKERLHSSERTPNGSRADAETRHDPVATGPVEAKCKQDEARPALLGTQALVEQSPSDALQWPQE